MWYNIVMLWGNTPHLQALAVPADNIVIRYDDNKRIKTMNILDVLSAVWVITILTLSVVGWLCGL